ncbi:hypothetical protein B2M27_24065 [Kluyvera intermedia]|uniref:Uncharacterized protein n=1 Tax=Kluyvera intermedia TaxID=61648 RepID=A0ABX3U8H1_KLUIN|nr:hypothetical protein [Kluyvera intermedia]AUU90232.1 hypothetical protein C2U55_14665 [Enterobacteriaceae bacterium ENNIH3]AUV09681.1 hypothetical protein C2U52_27220 [Enterobacteriaceae bacterium ENNIH2]ORJ47830.1 hypothetical protein B2M27_24065 [Kluyvera intermedia]
MEAHTTTLSTRLYIHLNLNPYTKNRFIISTTDMGSRMPDHYLLLSIMPIEFEFTVPDAIEIIGTQVEQLRAQKQQIAMQTETRLAELEDKIQQLLCLDHTPEDVHHIPF